MLPTPDVGAGSSRHVDGDDGGVAEPLLVVLKGEQCEGEEEGEEWAFYVSGFTMDELLPLVQRALPEEWTALLTDDQIAVTRG